MSASTPERVSRFDLWSSTYDRSMLQPLYQAAHLAVLATATTARTPTRILDVGCGTGRLLSRLRQQFPSATTVIGIDPSLPMLARARATSQSPGVFHVAAAAENLPFRDASFGLVTATMSLRHWVSPAVGIAEVARVLEPEGTFIIADLFRSCSAMKRPRPPSCLAQALNCAALRVTQARHFDGFGPVSLITVFTAVRAP